MQALLVADISLDIAHKATQHALEALEEKIATKEDLKALEGQRTDW